MLLNTTGIFMGFSVCLHIYMESEVLKLRFNHLLESVNIFLGKHLYVYKCPLLAFLFL